MSKRINLKEIVIIVFVLILSILLGFLTTSKNTNRLGEVQALTEVETPVITQEITTTLEEPVKILKLYYKDTFIGVINSRQLIEDKLNEVYEKEYIEEFPKTDLGFHEDLYVSTVMSYNQYENKDQEIFDYIYQDDLIAIKVPKIEFTNGDIIYVKNISDFNNARELFIKSYISETTYDLLRNKKKIPPLKKYGEQAIDFKVMESVKTSSGYASIGNILLDDTAILNHLTFGRNPKYKDYTVKEFDMIDGIAYLNGLSVNQLMAMNKEIIKEPNQIIPIGTKLNVTEFNSPFTVRVTKERYTEEIIEPAEPVYQKDPSLREGLTKVAVKEEKGLKDVTYEDVYENDVPISSNQKTSKVTKQPVRGVIKVGTYVEPKVGSGRFIWPMKNARMTCGWGCYAGHRAVDIQSRSNRGYGPIYAIDRGTIQANGYHARKGYFVEINHNNGFVSEYFHMNSRGYLPVGATVKRGEQIGYVGMTGVTNGPHVHLLIRKNGQPVNPCNYIGC